MKKKQNDKRSHFKSRSSIDFPAGDIVTQVVSEVSAKEKKPAQAF